jgi:UDP-N-acetylmuramyl tripeptide synthase
VTGTNGKTTTTKIVTELLESTGLRVLTNPTGSNFTRGIVSAVLRKIDRRGNLPYDIAVLELDEAHALHFIKLVQPDYVLALNVMRDQLDRFGEIDYTAKLISTVAQSATKAVILNRDDPRIARIADTLAPETDAHYFGAVPELRRLFVSDDELHGRHVSHEEPLVPADVELTHVQQQTAGFKADGKTATAELLLTGAYNFLNAAAAIATVRTVTNTTAQLESLVAALQKVEPGFGRGEKIMYKNQEIELVLVKNPAGFRLALSSFHAANTVTMIAINDQYADGRDMSWLWDVDFSSLADTGVAMVSGVRAYDMALRLQYDRVAVAAVDTELKTALRVFLASPGEHKRVFTTYTAMLRLRKLLREVTDVKVVQ